MSNQPTVKDLQYFKDQVIRKHGFGSYKDYIEYPTEKLDDKLNDWEFHIGIIEEAAERYADHLVQQAKDAAFIEGAECQREWMGKYISLSGVPGSDEWGDIILKAPTIKSPYTTGEKGGNSANT